MKQGLNSVSSACTPPYFDAIGNSQWMSLPVLATASDVREAVRVLKRKPEGITAVQANDAFSKRLFDPRKVSAYEYWGIVSRDGDRLKLSSLGWEFANRLTPEAEVYRAVLKATLPYDAALVWTKKQKLEVVTHLEIGRFWKEQYPEALEGANEENFESYAASFFHICHAAEIGMLTVGRKGQPTRLLVYHEELGAYLGENGLCGQQRTTVRPRANGNAQHAHLQRSWTPTNSVAPRVFISHSHSLNVVRQIQEVLELADLESAVVERIPDDAALVSELAFEAMRRCDAGIIVITDRDYRKDHVGQVVVDQTLLVEVGAAFTHLDRRVVLLLKKSMVPLPPNLQEVVSCEFEGEDLIWDTAVQLVKIVKNFKQELEERPRSEH